MLERFSQHYFLHNVPYWNRSHKSFRSKNFFYKYSNMSLRETSFLFDELQSIDGLALLMVWYRHHSRDNDTCSNITCLNKPVV